MCTVVYSEMPGQTDRLRGIERREGSELGGVWSGVAWPIIVSVVIY